ncbi:hypothetical protein SLEP1_g40406 [Rubroshorea leprosula]|uniref:Uncharacterized protein n=1 Tax=Rubroshorea leprosula TaxID=152421 RepID=A0AAV5L4P2_9ROSI|nr:hypothetical protein SLEP1_g40406 [Rubroshorea leprosula]
MASIQCYKPTELSCHQVQQEHSFSEKVTEVASWAVDSHGSQKDYSETEYYSQTQAQNTNNGTEKSQVQYFHSQTQADHPNQRQGHHQASNGMVNRHGTIKKRGERKQGLLHRLKDKISGDSSSDSESDDEKRGRGKSC